MTRLYAKRHNWDPSGGYTAYIEGDDLSGPDNLTGWGPTEADAIADLEEARTAAAIRSREAPNAPA